jgi:hypothetical protein
MEYSTASRASLIESIVFGQQPLDNISFPFFTLLGDWIVLSNKEVLSIG